ncbi:DUF3231 family protein [Rossellomorea aquimaris]|uniref:DUF3231 family protein n=1 Tax=Rossellomorea aquimaris TaxID=189382 RepID=UPI001CD40793|nr:DUF3231 family protein [Rossellomorea aquimaris]MCA1054985.1 DUF3231 family protein [Rossellomorea aquimaris]
MPDQPALTSSELGVLWITYQQKTMVKRILEHLIKHADDAEAEAILKNLYNDISPYPERIKDMLVKEGAAPPIGFTAEDVNLEAPKLFDNGFDISFVRILKEISMGMHTLNITMSYREDVIVLFQELTIITQRCYAKCTAYLLEKGLLSRAPFVPMPKTAEFIKSTSYLGGLTPISKTRHLNTVEISNLFHGIESNITGIIMVRGFAQVAQEKDAREFFERGSKIAKDIVDDLSEIMRKSKLQIPIGTNGNVSDSKTSPFSDKLMMYCVSLFCSFSVGSGSIGTAFSLRNDLPAKMMLILEDIFNYGHDGAKIMIKHGWMEEPPKS